MRLWIGSVSPVPRGVSQVFPRPSSPPPLPKEIEVTWEDSRGGTYTRRLSLKPVIQSATGQPGETLVIEISAPGEAAVLPERRQ